ncbi:MAG TPA: hypothetical protein VGR82_18780 [Methylomirabilota bacterium]|jgi:hypothetical protein|nr:hypothetical protein [Methylomirabilota bacterium]
MTLLGVAVILALPLTTVLLLLAVVDALQRRRDAVVERQIAVTDAIHRELGAVVAPVVRRARRGWRVELPMAPEHPGASRAIALAALTLEGQGAIEVAVLAPAASRQRRAPASPRPALAGARFTR